MPNPFIPRDRVHAWSESIAEAPDAHRTALPRLLKSQRRLTRWVQENAANMHPTTGGIANYLIGVVARLFDLAGGRLRGATWEQIRAAEQRVGPMLVDLLPFDDGFVERARGVPRAQPHILDEALMALFLTDVPEGEEEPDAAELVKIYGLMWVATEVLDANWTPPRGFEGIDHYAYVHIEPRTPEPTES